MLNGQKHYITGVESASKIMVVARISQDEAMGRGRLSVLVSMSTRRDSTAPGSAPS